MVNDLVQVGIIYIYSENDLVGMGWLESQESRGPLM